MNYEAKWGEMINSAEQIKRCADIINSVIGQTNQIKNGLYLTGSPSVLYKIKFELQKCVTSLDTCSGKASAIGNLISESANIYKANERKLVGISPQASSYISNIIERPGIPSGNDVENNVYNNIGFLFGKIMAYIACATGTYRNGLLSSEGNLYIGKAYAKWDSKFNIFDWENEYNKYINGKTNEEALFMGLKISGGAGVSLLSADGKITYGTDILSLGVGAEGDLLTAFANADVKIGGTYKDGQWVFDAFAEGEVIVAAAKGEVEGTINIFGIEITPKIGGYAGGAGVEGKIGYESGKGFVIEGGVAAIVGIKGGVTIGWDADGFIETLDTIGSAAADAWDFIVFWD